MKLRVAFDGRVIADHYPGIGRCAFGLARALAPHADVLLIRDPRAANTRYDLSGLAVEDIPLPLDPVSLSNQRRVARAIESAGADVYHSPYFAVFPAPLIAEPPCPSVFTFYDLIPLSGGGGYSFIIRRAIHGLHWYLGHVAERVIVLSPAAREAFVAKVKLAPAKIAVIRPGVDAAFRPRSLAEVDRLRARLKLPDEYLLYVGTNKPHKNLIRLIEAYTRLPRAVPPLILAGAHDPRYPQARAAVERLGMSDRIRFLGPVAEADLPALYSGAGLFVLTSLEEGFGLPVLEAMACGTPVACSDTAGLAEAAGAAALKFNPAAIDEIAGTLASLLADADQRDAMRRKGFEHAASFSWERAALETLKVYEAAIGKA